MLWLVLCFFFFKQKTAYEMRISDWSSDVSSSDLDIRTLVGAGMAWSLNGVAGMTEKPLLSVPRGRTVVVDFRNDTRWPHAMHFHGHHFKVLERDGKPTEHETWKDTVLIDPQKAAKIAFVEIGRAHV